MGTLYIRHKNVTADFLNKNIHPPVPAIEFNTDETDAGALLDYIAAATNSTVMTAIESLGKYCNQLKGELNAKAIATINMVGSFSSGPGGKIQFNPSQLPAGLLPLVHAERVIHPEASHNMLVGDKETTTVQMAEYFTESPAIKDRWWIWAVLLAAAALLAVLLYYNDILSSSTFGNISPAL